MLGLTELQPVSTCKSRTHRLAGVGEQQLHALALGLEDQVLQQVQAHGVDMVHGRHVDDEVVALWHTLRQQKMPEESARPAPPAACKPVPTFDTWRRGSKKQPSVAALHSALTSHLQQPGACLPSA